MKNIFTKTWAVSLISLVVLSNTGCSKMEDFGTINERTDAATTPITSFLLTNAEASIGSLFSSTGGGIRASLYAQQWAETQYTDVSLYGNPQIDFGGTYAGALNDLQKIIDLNTNSSTKSSLGVIGTPSSSNGSNNNQIAVATILKAYYLWTITDRWGDIPYTEAFKGAGNLTPKYDKQSDIYPHLLNDLKTAIATFDGGSSVTKGDILYGGDISKWKKLANSLRMLISLRMSKVYPGAGEFAANEFSAAFNDPAGSIDENADNLVIKYPGGSTLQTNVFYSALNGRKDYAFCKTFSDILDNMADPRKTAFTGSGAGFPYGLVRLDAVTITSFAIPFDGVSTTTPLVVLPASYVLLSKAEAVERGWVTSTTTSKAYYESAVTESFKQNGKTAAEAATYLASSQANFETGTGGGDGIGYEITFEAIQGADAKTNNKLERIQLQRYIASWGDGIQAWSEWRRTGIPRLVPTKYGVPVPNMIPRRLTYGTTEYAANPASVSEAAGRLSEGDVLSSRMWWDK